ncbi:hypothetical protein BDZ91DRAFT_727762 [Kalaharituber pfeilii]|nr:hypothetical protein BDZ91DRAFT_727762 [Kalaharituber pfeilii]
MGLRQHHEWGVFCKMAVYMLSFYTLLQPPSLISHNILSSIRRRFVYVLMVSGFSDKPYNCVALYF